MASSWDELKAGAEKKSANGNGNGKSERSAPTFSEMKEHKKEPASWQELRSKAEEKHEPIKRREPTGEEVATRYAHLKEERAARTKKEEAVRELKHEEHLQKYPWAHGGYLYNKLPNRGVGGFAKETIGGWRKERQHTIAEKRRAFGESYKHKKSKGKEWTIPGGTKTFGNPLMGGGMSVGPAWQMSPWGYTQQRKPGRPTPAQGPPINPMGAMPFSPSMPSRGRGHPAKPINPGSVPMPRAMSFGRGRSNVSMAPPMPSPFGGRGSNRKGRQRNLFGF
jgi:hypothetical protein